MEKVGQKHTFTHKLITNHNFQTIFLAQLSPNVTHIIVGYKMEPRVHQRYLQKCIRWRYLRRQEVRLILDSNMQWRLPTLECILQRQHFSAFRPSPQNFQDIVPPGAGLDTPVLRHESQIKLCGLLRRSALLLSRLHWVLPLHSHFYDSTQNFNQPHPAHNYTPN